MLTRRGFTVVELVVVMVIMAILLTLAGLSISASRANARDTQRTASVDILARGLEARYTQGKLNQAVTVAPANVAPGSYPSTNEMRHIMGQSVAGFTPVQIANGYGPAALPGTALEAFSPPGISAYTGLTLPSACTIENTTCIGGVVTKDTYYYEPIDTDGTLCNTNTKYCVRFNLYWRRETGDTTLQTYRSKHQ